LAVLSEDGEDLALWDIAARKRQWPLSLRFGSGPAAAMVLAKTLTTKDSPQYEKQQYARLTPRERDVLRLVGYGFSAPEIGARLSISPKTVDTYKQRIQEKLDLSHRSQYVQFALKLGLLVAE